MKTYRNFVNGKYVDAADGRTIPVINPSTEEQYATAPLSASADVDQAIQVAADAFETWRYSTPKDRSLALFRIADAIEARAEEFIALESENCGKPIGMTRSEEIPPMVDHVRFFATAARHLEGKSAGEYVPNMTSYIRREPIGVCAQVAPWNYPMMMAVWKFAPAIAAGNTVVLKPSDTTPVSTTLLAEICAEFLPAGVMNVICGDRDTGRAMVSHKTPSLVSVTGSVRAGMEVAESASKSLKRVHLELGGKNPVIVFDDADLERALDAVIFMIYSINGERCTSSSRLLVQDTIRAEFEARLVERVNKIKVGHPLDPATEIGPLVTEEHFKKVTSYFDIALQDGATIAAGGETVGDEGYFIRPTLFTNASNKMRIAQEEIFGPVLTSIPFSTEEQALEMANDTQYGLTGYVWTNDLTRALRFTDRLEAGMIWVNSENVRHLPTPFGGVKASGIGRDGGDW